MWTLLLIFSCLSCPVIGQLKWRLITEGVTGGPDARRDAAIGYDESSSKVILFGGRGDANKVFDDTWIYEIIPKRWTKLNLTLSPPARFSFVSGVKDSNFYITTGEGSNRFFFDDIWRFDIQNNLWEHLPAQHKPTYYTQQRWELEKRNELKPALRYGAAGGIFKGSSSARLYLSMGFSRKRFSDTFSYSFTEKGWFRDYPDQNPYNPAYPHARCLHAGTMISRDELLIFGGCLSGGGSGGPCPSSDSWIFNGKTKNWKQLKNCAAARTYSTLAMLPIEKEERRAILFGGQVNSSQVILTVEPPAEQIGVFNPDLEKWTLRRTEGQIPSRRSSVAMATGRTGVFMFGGFILKTAKVTDEFYELVGDASMADKAPVSADCSPSFFSQIMLHGIFMVLAWGFFLPWGAFIARHMKHREPLWFHLHRLFQVTGLLLAIAGVICAIMSVQFDHVKFVHAIIGTVVMIVGIQQPMNAIIRCPKPEEGERKTLRRAVWEFSHRFLGHGAIYLGLANICLGIFLAMAHQIIWIVWFAYLGFLLVAHFIAEVIRQYRCTHGGMEENLKMSTINKYVINDGCENAYEDR